VVYRFLGRTGQMTVIATKIYGASAMSAPKRDAWNDASAASAASISSIVIDCETLQNRTLGTAKVLHQHGLQTQAARHRRVTIVIECKPDFRRSPGKDLDDIDAVYLQLGCAGASARASLSAVTSSTFRGTSIPGAFPPSNAPAQLRECRAVGRRKSWASPARSSSPSIDRAKEIVR
jgi:hypothetical protein